MNNKREKDYTKVFKVLEEIIKNYLEVGETYKIKQI